MKIVSIPIKETEELHKNLFTDECFEYAKDWIKQVGCYEMQIIITSGCQSFSETFDTNERTDAGLGAIMRYATRYANELNALDDEDSEE